MPSPEARPPSRRDGTVRFGAVAGEAWRNVVSGTTRAFLLAAVFAVVLGSLGWVQGRLVVGLVQDAQRFKASGAATEVVTLQGGIDGAQCDALTSAPGIVASGALRAGPDLTLAVLPSRTIGSLEASPGFGRLLDLDSWGQAWSAGAWVASDLGTALGLRDANAGAGIPLRGGGTIPVDGIYNYPDDGRNPVLKYQVVAPVAPVKPFDQCWVLAWPDSSAATQLLMLPVIPQIAATAADNQTAQITQLNTTLGTTFDGTTRFTDLPLTPLMLAGAVLGLFLGLLSVRIRRLELASTLHAGLARSSLALQLLIETSWWLLLALAPALAACRFAAALGNTTDWWPAFYPATRTLLLAALCTLLGAQLAVATTRERHLFRYFKNR